MFTAMDKALVAAICGAIYVWNALSPWHIGVSPATVQTIVGVVAPILVYLVPNKA